MCCLGSLLTGQCKMRQLLTSHPRVHVPWLYCSSGHSLLRDPLGVIPSYFQDTCQHLPCVTKQLCSFRHPGSSLQCRPVPLEKEGEKNRDVNVGANELQGRISLILLKDQINFVKLIK